MNITQFKNDKNTSESNFFSSCIDQALFNKSTGQLIVRFSKNQEYYGYKNVSEHMYDDVFNNGSVGRRFHKYKSWMESTGKIQRSKDEQSN